MYMNVAGRLESQAGGPGCTNRKILNEIVLSDETQMDDMVTKHFNEWFVALEYAKTPSLHIPPT